MKALLSLEAGGPATLVLRDMPSLVAGTGQLQIKVKAVGVNYPDSLIIEDRYQYRPERPFAPGSECAGIVMDVGEGVSGFRPGDRVLGTCVFGAMAEEALLEAGRCYRIPDAMSFEEAAAFMLTFGTSYYALHSRGRLQPDETLLVLGAGGGVGLAAVQLGKAMGARVIAAASSESKIAAARKAGADAGLVYPASVENIEGRRELSATFKKETGGVDIVFDAVGGAYCEAALRAMNWCGRYLVVGFPAGIPAPPLNIVLLKSCEIIGVFWGAFVDRHPGAFDGMAAQLFAYFDRGLLRPNISARYDLVDGGAAIAELSARVAIGKIVVTM